MSEERLQVAIPLGKRLRRAAAAVAQEAVGVLGLVLVCAGVQLLWGTGWTLVVAGAVLLGVYVWSELRLMKYGGRVTERSE